MTDAIRDRVAEPFPFPEARGRCERGHEVRWYVGFMAAAFGLVLCPTCGGRITRGR